MNKKVLIGITGSIAIYKVSSLVRLLLRNKIEMRVVMTKAATKLISPLTFQALSRNPVYDKMFKAKDPGGLEHISLVNWADVFIVAPATANTIGKMANGIADNLLTTIFLAFPRNKPIIIAPAMETNMWYHAIVQENISKLKTLKNIHIVEPESGLLGSTQEGKGRLAAIEDIFEVFKKISSDD